MTVVVAVLIHHSSCATGTTTRSKQIVDIVAFLRRIVVHGLHESGAQDCR